MQMRKSIQQISFVKNFKAFKIVLYIINGKTSMEKYRKMGGKNN